MKWFYVGLLLFMGGAVGMMAYGMSARGGLSPFIAIGWMLELPVMTLLMTWVGVFATEKSVKNRMLQTTLSVTGVTRTIEPVKRGDIAMTTKWDNVRRVAVDSNGDLLIFSHFGFAVLSVPAGAFADANVVSRFRDAAITLWQTNGNMSAVPDAVRQEFAPPP